MSQLNSQIDLLLTQASNGYFPEGLEAENIMPAIKVEHSTGKLGAYGTSHLRIESTLKAGRGKYRTVETNTYSTTTYSIDGHGLEDIVTPDDYRNVLAPFDAEKDKTLGTALLIALEKEQTLSSALMSSANFTSYQDLSAGAGSLGYFSDYNNSDVVSQFNTACNTVLDACGVPPDTIVMDRKVARILRYHPQFMDALGLKYARPGGATDQEIADLLGVDRIVIPYARYESAKEGQASAMLPIWGKHIWVGVLPKSAVPRQVSAGYMVTYAQQPKKVWKWPVKNPPDSNALLAEDSYQFLLSGNAASCGYLFKNAVA